MICKHCGTHQRGERRLPGSGWIELVLWLFWVLPGLIYSIWRRTGSAACVSCGKRDLVDDASPWGKQLLHQNYPGGAPAPLPPAPPAKANPVVHWITVGLLAFLGVVLVGTAGVMLAAFR